MNRPPTSGPDGPILRMSSTSLPTDKQSRNGSYRVPTKLSSVGQPRSQTLVTDAHEPERTLAGSAWF